MARRDGGTPVYAARQRAVVFVTVEPKDGSAPRYRKWTGSSCASIKRSARAKYGATARLGFSKCVWVTR